MKVAITGAGLSGLSAGYELSKKGIDVSIFESKDVGGLAASYYVNGKMYPLNTPKEIIAIPISVSF